MSETNEIDLNKLHHIVLRETESDSIQEITLRYPTLEDVFLNATGSSIRGLHV